ncbi:hypothetical protein H4219_003847 [Mycoemilia scoparia]|uniref:Uncharacterized protein n=1 Tax=Mycoemilia scoparia TaxID=417184 RepID=A0A9W7ZUD4_9FUNG|nr:hypothetical protein H4219_003847 [Mycoemilia scoparia]
MSSTSISSRNIRSSLAIYTQQISRTVPSFIVNRGFNSQRSRGKHSLSPLQSTNNIISNTGSPYYYDFGEDIHQVVDYAANYRASRFNNIRDSKLFRIKKKSRMSCPSNMYQDAVSLNDNSNNDRRILRKSRLSTFRSNGNQREVSTTIDQIVSGLMAALPRQRSCHSPFVSKTTTPTKITAYDLSPELSARSLPTESSKYYSAFGSPESPQTPSPSRFFFNDSELTSPLERSVLLLSPLVTPEQSPSQSSSSSSSSPCPRNNNAATTTQPSGHQGIFSPTAFVISSPTPSDISPLLYSIPIFSTQPHRISQQAPKNKPKKLNRSKTVSPARNREQRLLSPPPPPPPLPPRPGRGSSNSNANVKKDKIYINGIVGSKNVNYSSPSIINI